MISRCLSLGIDPPELPDSLHAFARGIFSFKGRRCPSLLLSFLLPLDCGSSPKKRLANLACIRARVRREVRREGAVRNYLVFTHPCCELGLSDSFSLSLPHWLIDGIPRHPCARPLPWCQAGASPAPATRKRERRKKMNLRERERYISL